MTTILVPFHQDERLPAASIPRSGETIARDADVRARLLAALA